MIKSDFLTKFNQLVKSVIPRVYPEGKNDYTPDFTRPVRVETSFFQNLKTSARAKEAVKKLDLAGLEWTYNRLEDEYSREMMLKVLVFNLFEEVKLRFPLYYDHSLAKLDDYDRLMALDDEKIKLWWDIITLKKYDLSHLGYDIKAWLTLMGVFIDFVNEQYRYKDIVKAEKGDWVIDGGACYGDTALYFAAKTGARVFSFEFLDENLDIFRKNMALNPQHAANIVIVDQPLGDKSGDKLYAVSNGPGTSVTDVFREDAKEFETISIDDFVERHNIEKIDFIKLDVECSEVPVLKGAARTIRRFKPKLAVCVYHKHDDLWTIPQLITELLPEYKLYLDHHTISFTETLVYAKI